MYPTHAWKENSKKERVCLKCGIVQTKVRDFGGKYVISLRNGKWEPKVSQRCYGEEVK